MNHISEIIIKLNRLAPQIQTLRDQIAKFAISDLAKLPYSEMYSIYKNGLKQKQAERIIENWVAHHLNIEKKSSVNYDKINNCDGLDLGDLVVGKKLVPGVNNIELKVSFEGRNIGGGQFRFYEDVAGYLFLKSWSVDRMELFYLTRQEMISEIRNRATQPKKIDASGNAIYYVALGSSQGSGKIKGSNEDRLRVLDQNIEGSRQDQIGWSFNTKTETQLYEHWRQKYMYSIDELKDKLEKMLNEI